MPASIQIFLSAVTAEFGSYRDVLRHSLDRPNVSVKVQEDFITGGQETLEKLDAYIQRCAAVVHLVGDMTGAMAPAGSASLVQQRYRDFTRRFPILEPCFEPHGMLLSYTQWEAWLALYHGKDLIIVVPEEGATRDARYQLDPAQRIVQQQHLNHLKSCNRHPTSFRNSDHLAAQLLRSNLPDILLNAGVGQPVSRPISSRTLRDVCNIRLRERIAEVSQRKYLPDLYVQRRSAQLELQNFIETPARYRMKVITIFAQLERIRAQFILLGVSAAKLTELRDVMLTTASRTEAESCLQSLQRQFMFAEVEAVDAAIYDVLSVVDFARVETSLTHFEHRLRRLPYLSRAEAEQARVTLEEEYRRSLVRSSVASGVALNDIRQLLPSLKVGQKLVLANDLIKQLEEQWDTVWQPCLALVDRAGRGKTNVLLNAASEMAQTSAVLVFGGQGIPASFRGIETLVQEELDRDAPGQFLSWLPRVCRGLQADDAWMYLFIDGINEVLEPLTLARQLSEFLEHIQGHRIRLILSCRDIFWESFAHLLRPYLSGGRPVHLSDFNARESTDAIPAYLAAYEIRAELGKDARSALSHPLLLRLFCEAYRGQTLGRIDSLRNVAVFDEYVRTATRQIADRLQFVDSAPVVDHLLRVAEQIWQRQQPSVDLEHLSISLPDATSLKSILPNLRNEGLLRENIAAGAAPRRTVSFVYDELLEYCLARHWMQKVSESGALASIIEEAAVRIAEFPYGPGALMYLDRLLGNNGDLMNQLLARLADLGDEVLILRQYIVLQVFERANIAKLDDRVLGLLVRFEERSTSDIKERIGALVVRIQRRRPDSALVRLLVNRCLEIEKLPGQLGQYPSESAAVGTVTDKHANDVEEATPKLPAARFHYSTEIRLNAIGLLIGGSDEDRDVARRAMERLGRMELSSALRAVQAFNMAPDEAVMSQIPSYLAERAPEYKLYSASLLKRRWGRKPAEILVSLLLDPNGRVREFTKRLLRERRAEIELIQVLLGRLKEPGILSLSDQINLLDALGSCAAGHATSSANEVAAAIGLLIARLDHPNIAIRLQAGRTLFSWREGLENDHLEHLRKQPDEVVKRLFHLLTRVALPR